MTVTAIDETSALIIVDLQKGALFSGMAHPVGDVVERTSELARAFRAASLPVFVISFAAGASGRSDATRARAEAAAAAAAAAPSAPAGEADVAPAAAPAFNPSDLIEELDVQSADVKITKSGWGSFTGTTLDEQLRALGVTQVIVTGVATSLGVESTAREARDRGYNVVLATDAMTDLRAEWHEHATTVVFPMVGESGTTADILALLQAR